MPHIGRIGVTVLLFFVIRIVLGAFGVTENAIPALVSVVLLEAVYFVLKRRRRKRQREKQIEGHAERELSEEQAFAVRVAEAEASGAFDRWNPKQ